MYARVNVFDVDRTEIDIYVFVTAGFQTATLMLLSLF